MCPSPEALLLVRASPTLFASVLLLCWALPGAPRTSWMEWASLVALVVPATVEAWRLRELRRKVRQDGRIYSCVENRRRWEVQQAKLKY